MTVLLIVWWSVMTAWWAYSFVKRGFWLDGLLALGGTAMACLFLRQVL